MLDNLDMLWKMWRSNLEAAGCGLNQTENFWDKKAILGNLIEWQKQFRCYVEIDSQTIAAGIDDYNGELFSKCQPIQYLEIFDLYGFLLVQFRFSI